jgi:hypothetical protein
MRISESKFYTITRSGDFMSLKAKLGKLPVRPAPPAPQR